MPTDPISFATLLTPPGVVVAAGLTTAFVELIKRVFPAIDARVSGALLAFVFDALLYILAALATGVADLDAGLLVFMAWLSCATSAVGISSTIEHAGSSGTG